MSHIHLFTESSLPFSDYDFAYFVILQEIQTLGSFQSNQDYNGVLFDAERWGESGVHMLQRHTRMPVRAY